MKVQCVVVSVGFFAVALASGGSSAAAAPIQGVVPVTVETFTRAETDAYLGALAEETGPGRFTHSRAPADVQEQDVVRMNRETLYSSAVIDLDAGSATIVLPESDGRFMSLQVVQQDHYTTDVAFAPARVTITREGAGTRYAAVLVRTLIDPNDPADIATANALQDEIRIEQARAGSLEMPAWDPASLMAIRDALKTLGNYTSTGFGSMFGTRDEVDPVMHLIGTAVGWGGNPPSVAVYEGYAPERNDGTTPHEITVRDVPVDAFWSVSVYNAEGYFEPNPQDAYSLSDVTAVPNADGSYTIRFGGDPGAPNYLAIMPGWNYTVRLYRPRQEILDGSWTFPKARAVGD